MILRNEEGDIVDHLEMEKEDVSQVGVRVPNLVDSNFMSQVINCLRILLNLPNLMSLIS